MSVGYILKRMFKCFSLISEILMVFSALRDSLNIQQGKLKSRKQHAGTQSEAPPRVSDVTGKVRKVAVLFCSVVKMSLTGATL